ncbi:MAG: hypothetical protein IPG04_34585 [Polyangiaceae bacterium]|nr:hypothetical protein [Polyangiaceae bacterium]
MRLELPDGRALELEARGATLTTSASSILIEAELPRSGSSPGVGVELVHPLEAAAHVFVPHLAPSDEHVMAESIFRAPAIVLADRALALALIPDLSDVAQQVGTRAWLDYDHPARRARLFAGDFVEDGHVFYRRRDLEARGQRVRLRLHVVTSQAPADLADPYGMTSRFLWGRWGKPAHAEGGSQRAPFTDYARHVVSWAFGPGGWSDSVWQTLDARPGGAGAPVFIVDVSRHPSVPKDQRSWREPRSVWNQAWFSTQRCANGLLRHARRIGSLALEDRARRMTKVALSAPQRRGLFPSVARPARGSGPDTWDGLEWTSSDRRPAGTSGDAVHLVDASFTCRLLLEWAALTPEPSASSYVDRYVERLTSLQRPSGAFPGWVEPNGDVSSELLESAESAMSVALLFEHARASGSSASLEAARRGLCFVEEVIADARWEDFETYYSCAPWGAGDQLGRRVERNGVYKQNTLSIAWAADAMLRAFDALGDERQLRLARRCAGELSLYQAVWDPPFLPAPAHGGFGVMNADSEWNDARQSLFAPLYLELYRHTGDQELLERGVAALRASFTMMYCPENAATRAAYERRFPFFGPESYGFMMENQGHGGGEPIGTFNIFTWGNGSALATAAKVHDLYGDVYVERERRRAHAIDATSARLEGSRVVIEDRFGRESLTAVDDRGNRRTVRLRTGRGSFELR